MDRLTTVIAIIVVALIFSPMYIREKIEDINRWFNANPYRTLAFTGVVLIIIGLLMLVWGEGVI